MIKPIVGAISVLLGITYCDVSNLFNHLNNNVLPLYNDLDKRLKELESKSL